MDPNQQNSVNPDQTAPQPIPVQPASPVMQPIQNNHGSQFDYQQPAPQTPFNTTINPQAPIAPNSFNQTQNPFAQQPNQFAQAPVNPAQFQQPSFQAPKNNSKKIVIVASVIAVAIAAIITAALLITNLSGLELEKYTNSNFGFTMEIPKGWKAEETDKAYSREVDFEEPVGDLKDKSKATDYTALINIDYKKNDSEYGEVKENEFFEDVKKSIQSGIKNQDEDKTESSSSYKSEKYSVDKEEMTTINSVKAYKVKIKVTNFDGDKDEIGYQYLTFIYIDKNNQFTISIEAHESETVNAKANAIIDSFKKK